MLGLIPLSPELSNGEVGNLVDVPLMDTLHPDGIALSQDEWSGLLSQRQAAGRPLHWWEVPTHG